MATGPRVLWATDEAPDRAGGGGGIRGAHLLEALASRAPTDLLLLGRTHDPRVRAAVSSIDERPSPPVRQLPSAVRRPVSLALAAAGRMPYELALLGRRRNRLRSALEERAERYDLVVMQHEAMAPALPRRRAGTWVLELHHVLSQMFEQQAATVSGRRAWLHRRDALAATRVEHWACDAFDTIVTCSDVDAAVVQANSSRRVDIVVAPNGVDLDAHRPTPLPPTPRIALPATLDYGPNVDGARWFADEVLPRVRDGCPDVEFDIVGRRPLPAVRALAARPGVAVHGDVPSMAPWIERARVVVVPLRIGTGSRLKALEAMAAGRPVVGTTIGMEGIDVEAGVHAEVTDDPVAMAAAVLRVLDDDGRAGALAAAGRALVEDRYGWDRIGARYADELLGRAGR